MKRILVVFGTRPEAIKMAPVIHALKKNSKIETKVCISSQHKELLLPVLNLFDIEVDYDLDVMRPNQSLSRMTSRILLTLDSVLTECQPDLVVVHGDTTTGFTASLSAFYQKIPVAHVEAGLRTGDMHSPWPEELNRRMIGGIANIHFSPTELCRENLLNEGVLDDCISVTGNTVIDSLMFVRNKINTQSEMLLKHQRLFEFLDSSKKLLLVTGHRRENYGARLSSICRALSDISFEYTDSIQIVYPVHLNPNIRNTVIEKLSGIPNVHLIQPVDYSAFVYLMEHAYLILTDSGGIQEEAPAFGKPVLVMRETTERSEAIDAGTALLVGTDSESIISHVSKLLESPLVYQNMSQAVNPFGDGKAADRISREIDVFLSNVQ